MRTPQLAVTFLVMSVFVLGVIFSAVAPGLILPTVGALAVIVGTIWVPELVVCLIVVLTLAGGQYASYSATAVPVMFLAGAVALAALVIRRRAVKDHPNVWLPSLVLVLIVIRFLLVDDVYSATVALRCVAVIILAYYTLALERDITRALAFAAVLFATVSFVVGETSLGNMRLMGWSGNPNRMVFGLLVLLPFLLSWLLRRRSVIRWLGVAVASLSFSNLLLASGSSQAIAGMVLILACGILCVIVKAPTAVKVLIWISLLFVVIYVLGTQTFEVQSDTDVSTLDGRTDLYAAAWNEFLRNPIFGTGEMRVTDGSVVDRSAHSSILGFLAAGGLIVGLPWALVMLRTSFSSFVALARPNIAGAAGLVLVVEQFVQAVEFQPLTWIVIVFLWADRVRKRETNLGEHNMAARFHRGENGW